VNSTKIPRAISTTRPVDIRSSQLENLCHIHLTPHVTLFGFGDEGPSCVISRPAARTAFHCAAPSAAFGDRKRKNSTGRIPLPNLTVTVQIALPGPGPIGACILKNSNPNQAIQQRDERASFWPILPGDLTCSLIFA
jgi:hypothetical protein